MKVFFDTTVIVEIDRKNEDVIRLTKNLVDKRHDILVSTITISEILAGSYLRSDAKKAVAEAKRLLAQFLWVDFDAAVAEKTAQYLAYLIAEGKPIEYQDVAIAASCTTSKADYLLTLNKTHFARIPDIRDKVYEPKEFKNVMP